jgi:signal transduction histidine kinase
MADYFTDLSRRQEIFKARLYFVSAFFCSFIFYFFMTRISAAHIDFFPGRIAIAVISISGLLSTFTKNKNIKIIRAWLLSVTFGYLFLYLYLLHLNNWSVFHRWSYFVVASILCSAALTWEEYVLNTIVGLFAPLFLSFNTPLSLLELVHFHSANIVTILIIGYSVRLHFLYKKEVSILSQNLIDQSKMKALGEMAAGVSHEVNNPLAVLSTSSDQLKKLLETESYDKQKVFVLLEKVARMTNRISVIVSGLKDFSSKDESQFVEKIDINEIIKHAVLSKEKEFRAANIKIILQLSKNKIYIRCDKILISDAISNLLNNAFEACKEEDKPQVKISVGSQNGFAKVSITDNGPGVPLEFMDKIMQPFFTTKELGMGPGLGLSSALGIAQKHDGKLFLDKDVSMSTFTLLLPKA